MLNPVSRRELVRRLRVLGRSRIIPRTVDNSPVIEYNALRKVEPTVSVACRDCNRNDKKDAQDALCAIARVSV
jgi:hypothetical protein